MEFCSHFEQIADPPNFLRELALKFCFRQKSLKLRHSSNWAANLFKIWQNSNAAFVVFYLFFIIYQKTIVWTITVFGAYVKYFIFIYRYQECKPIPFNIHYKNGYLLATVGTRLHLASGWSDDHSGA